MGMAISLQAFFESHPLHYSIVSHDYTESSQHTAAAIHQTGYRVAKSVLLKDDESYLLAVLPACYRLHLGKLHHALDRNLGLFFGKYERRIVADINMKRPIHTSHALRKVSVFQDDPLGIVGAA